MIDYNDGKWHGWNGGECPVHPKTQVEVQHKTRSRGPAHIYQWGITVDVYEGPAAIVSFRVVKEYRESQEWWLAFGRVFESRDDAQKAFGTGVNAIRVREVLD